MAAKHDETTIIIKKELHRRLREEGKVQGMVFHRFMSRLLSRALEEETRRRELDEKRRQIEEIGR